MVYQNPYAGSILQAAGRGGQLELERKAKEEEDRRRNAEESKSLGQAGLGALVALAGTALTAGLGAPAAVGAGAGIAGGTAATGAGTAATAAPSLMGNIGAGLGRAGAALTSPSNLAQAAMAGKAGYSPTPGAGLIAGLEPAAKGVIDQERRKAAIAGLPAGVEPSKFTIGPEGKFSSEWARPATAPQFYMGGAMPGQPPPQPAVGQYQVGETATDDATGEKFKWDGSQWVNVLTGQPQ